MNRADDFRMSDEKSEFLDVHGVMSMTGLPQRTINKAGERGTLPRYKFGTKTIRYKRADVEEWIESCRQVAS